MPDEYKNHTGLTVLLIDDNPDDRALVERELKQVIEGERVVHISDQQGLNEILGTDGFDVAITDYHLRWSTGTQVLERLKERFPQKPVIMFTGSGNEEIAVQAMKEGLDDYITKSVKHYPRVPYAVLGCFDRVSKREALQQALERESLAKARLEIALESANMGTWQVDLATYNLVYSDAIGPMFGHRAGYVHPHFNDWFNEIHPDDQEQVKVAWEAALSGDQYYAAEFRALGADRRTRWIASSGKVVRNVDGQPSIVIGTARDVTDAVATREEMRRQRQELQTILDVLPVGVAISRDPLASQVTLTPYCARMLGADVDASGTFGFEVRKGRPFEFLRNGKPVDPNDMPMQRAARTGEGIRNEELEVRLADGRVLNVLVNAAPLLDAARKVSGAVGALVDITSLKKIQQELERADRQKNEFLSVLAHELRNPMAAIGYSVALLQHVTTPQAIERARDVIERQTQHMGRLLDDLLDLSRITRNKIELDSRPLDLRHVLELGLESVQPMLDSSQHALSVNWPARPMHVLGDEVRLTQVFSNILNNAAKFTPPNGKIEIRAETQGDKVVVEVIDTGVGIEPGQLEYVFEMFSQTQSKIGGGTSGLGIGLAIVRKLVELHGGSVNAYSNGNGQGTRVRVELPLLENNPSISEPAASQESQAQSQMRVLVADDNVDAADILSEVLRLNGYVIQTVYDGRSAIETAERLRPDVAILDIGMPFANGYDVAKWIRAQPWGHSITLIAVTGWGQANDRNATLQAGFDIHLVKPVRAMEVARSISELQLKKS